MKIEWPTVVVMVVGVLAVGACVYFKADPEYVGALGVAVAIVLAKMKAAWTTPPKDG